MSDRTKGFLFALLAAILYGLVPILGKKFVTIFSPLFAAIVVIIVSDFYLITIAILKGELFKNILKKSARWVIVLGLFASLGSYFSFVGLTYGKASAAGFFFQFEAFFAAVLAFIFLREKLSKHQIIGLMLMLIGAAIFSAPFTFNLGNLFFLAAALAWGFNSVITRSKVRELSPFFLAVGRNTFSALFLLPLAYKYIAGNIGLVNATNVFFFLIYGAVIAGFLLSSYTALKFIKAGEATSVQFLAPLFTLAVAFVVLSERFTALQLFGGALVLSGLYLIVKFKS